MGNINYKTDLLLIEKDSHKTVLSSIKKNNHKTDLSPIEKDNKCIYCEKMAEIAAKSNQFFPDPAQIVKNYDFNHTTKKCKISQLLYNHNTLLIQINQIISTNESINMLKMSGIIKNYILLDNLAFVFYIDKNKLPCNIETNSRSSILGPFLFFIKNKKKNYNRFFYNGSLVNIYVYPNELDKKWLDEFFFVCDIKKAAHEFNEDDYRFIK